MPLTVRLTVQDTTASRNPVAGAAVEIRHCDAWGYYPGHTTASPGGKPPGGGQPPSGRPPTGQPPQGGQPPEGAQPPAG